MQRSPLVLGTLFAALAAIAFGVTTPLIRRFGEGVGPFGTAALLYFGAAFGAASWPRGPRKNAGGDPRARAGTETREAKLEKKHIPRLLAVAFFGAALAPVLFAWGLQRVPATYGALLLNGEAVFTVGLAAAVHHEYVGRRVALAVFLMFAGGAVTLAGASFAGTVELAGALAVTGAVFSWALDNVLTRPFADFDPPAVVRAKALAGVVFTASIALAMREARPPLARAAALLACGVVGYGLSLRCYLLAQRRIGAGRTGSVFAVAPFVGAVGAIALGDRPAGVTTALAGLLFGAGVCLHLTEGHEHEHEHNEVLHDHAHTHDDGHHNHRHDPMPIGPHAHDHRHEHRMHAHAHGPDLHHGHAHRH